VIGLGSDALPDDGTEGLELFVETYAYAKQHGLKVSAHCAEQPGTAANFDFALDILKCDRIDHGYRVLDQPKVLARARDEGTWFTCAPTSTSQVYGWPDMSRHPIPMFKTDIGREFVVSCNSMGFDADKATELALNGVDGSWLDESERRTLRASFVREIAELRSQLVEAGRSI